MILYDYINGTEEYGSEDAISKDAYKWDVIGGVVHIPYDISLVLLIFYLVRKIN